MAEAKNVVIPRADFEDLLESAAERGAKSALKAVGLHDDEAAADVRDLRGLLDAWRDAKTTAMRTAVGMATKALLLGLAAWFGLKMFLKD